jgi:transcriptional regulator with XRE-family HTH domain
MSKTPQPETFTGRLERAMRDAGYNPRSLSLAAGLGMTAVRDIVDGRIGSPRYATIEALAKVLGVTVAFLANGEPGAAETAAIEARDFPIYGAALSGSNGVMVRSSDPIQQIARPDSLLTVISSYGVFVVGEAMSPAYEQGDIALVHPSLPPRRGADVILSRRGPDGTTHLLIRCLLGWSDTEWQVRQHNPAKEFKLPRDEWTEIQTIVGRYNAR